MPKLNLKPNHKAIRDYHATLQEYEQQGIRHESAVSSPFESLLHACAKQVNATLVPQSALGNWHTAVSDFRAYVPESAICRISQPPLPPLTGGLQQVSGVLRRQAIS